LGRPLKHLLDLVADLQRRGIGLISLNDAINTSSSQGRLVLNLFASLAEFERTLAGLAAARAQGRVGGRKPGLSEEAERAARAAELRYNARQLSVEDMTRSLRICKTTFYKYLPHRGVALHTQPLPRPVAITG
jgi:DNA invertase Pin-like site-specific DNA recombinase